MVRIRKKVIGTQTYYYLEHAVRQEGKVKKKERYLGKKLPKNIEMLKREFLLEIYKEKWYPSFDRIRRNYNDEISLMPPTAKEKNKSHPVELAALMHLKFVTIHPFADGNGRISRLMMNFVLHKHVFPLLIIHYENRASYYNALERAQIKNFDNIFAQWLFRRYVNAHKMYL